MASLAEKVYMDLMARGKDIKTARRWRNWTTKFEACCESKYDRDDIIKYLSHGGGGRIRTYVALWAADLQSAPINHSGTPPRPNLKPEPERGVEPTNLPITSRLRYHCATRAIYQILKIPNQLRAVSINKAKAKVKKFMSIRILYTRTGLC